MVKQKVSKKLKKGGKSKGKKGKKGSKKGGEKVDKELVYKEAVSQCKIWEHKLAAIELSRQEYKDHAHKLLKENESLHQAMRGTERDTIEVIAYLKKEAGQKEAMVSLLIYLFVHCCYAEIGPTVDYENINRALLSNWSVDDVT